MDNIEKKVFEAGNYDVIVVGAGHAGCEAALAPSRMGLKTLVIKRYQKQLDIRLGILPLGVPVRDLWEGN